MIFWGNHSNQVHAKAAQCFRIRHRSQARKTESDDALHELSHQTNVSFHNGTCTDRSTQNYST